MNLATLDDRYRVTGTFRIADLFELLTYRASNDPDVTSRLESTLSGRFDDPADPSRCTLIKDWQPRHTRRLWYILGPWLVVVVTFPILVYRFWRATKGELILDG